MSIALSQLRKFFLLVGAVLISGAMFAPRPAPDTMAQEPLTVQAVEQFFFVGVGNPQGGLVDYSSNVKVNDPKATLSCDPDNGVFRPGGYKITCTATRGAEVASTFFYVLVAYGDDTDVSLKEITQSPENPTRLASTVIYQVQVRNNGGLTARRPLVTGTIPEAITLKLTADDRCKLGEGRALTCTLQPLGQGKGDIVQLVGQVEPGFAGNFQLRLSISLGDGQRDLEESLNTFTKTTVVQDPGFGENAVFIPLVSE
jgi:uncharacterized repeat protein (TIGR01451 family)